MKPEEMSPWPGYVSLWFTIKSVKKWNIHEQTFDQYVAEITARFEKEFREGYLSMASESLAIDQAQKIVDDRRWVNRLIGEVT